MGKYERPPIPNTIVVEVQAGVSTRLCRSGYAIRRHVAILDLDSGRDRRVRADRDGHRDHTARLSASQVPPKGARGGRVWGRMGHRRMLDGSTLRLLGSRLW